MVSLAAVKSDRLIHGIEQSTLCSGKLERRSSSLFKEITKYKEELYTGIRFSRTSSRSEHPLVSPPVRAMTGRGVGDVEMPQAGKWNSPNLTLFPFFPCYRRTVSTRIKLLSVGGVETLIVVEQHKRVGVNPAKREEGEHLCSNKTSTARLQSLE